MTTDKNKTTTAAPRKRSERRREQKSTKAFKPKELSNTVSTGGGGGGFENRFQAVRLLAMLTGEYVPEHREGRVVRLLFQAAKHGYKTDDLICIAQDEQGSTRRALIQAKRSLRPSEGDSQFHDAVSAGWLDFRNPDNFNRGLDTLVIAHDTECYHKLTGARRVVQWARSSTSHGEFLNNFQPGASNEADRGALAAFHAVVADVVAGPLHPAQLFEFLKHVQFVAQALTYEEGVDYTDILNRIARAVGRSQAPAATWSQLVNACQQQSVLGAVVTISEAEAIVGSRMAAQFERHRTALTGNASLRTGAREVTVHEPTYQAASSGKLLPGSPAPELASSRRQVDALPDVPPARSSSLDKLVSAQLDAVNDQTKAYRYADAREALAVLGRDLGALDQHQKARWYLLRATCMWHTGDVDEAADSFIKSSQLCSDEASFAAAEVRGLMMRGESEAAKAAGKQALERFPESLQLWLVYTNVRLVLGETVSLMDTPSAHRQDANVLQVLAIGRLRAGDHNEAVELAVKSIAAVDCSYFARESALTVVLTKLAGGGLRLVFGLLEARDADALRLVADSFLPWNERLWPIQATDSVVETVGSLAYAYLMLGNPQRALQLIREATARGFAASRLMRPELEAIQQEEGLPAAIIWGADRIHAFPEDALVAFAQAAANAGDVARVETAIAAAAKLVDKSDDLNDSLDAIRWMALANSSQGLREQLANEVRPSELQKSTNMPRLCVGTRFLIESGRELDAEPLLSRVRELAEASPSRENLYFAAEVHFGAMRFREAASFYSRFLPEGQHSELHNHLLCSLVRGGNLQQARRMLRGLPDGWTEDEGARALAIELGQSVGDWPLLTRLADAQFAKAPTRASSWLFKFMVASRAHPLADRIELAAKIPDELQGSPKEIANIATMEARCGDIQRAMARMYRMRRAALDQEETASIYAVWHYAISDELPKLEVALDEVKEGASVVLEDADGYRVTITIDPSGFGKLPENNEFKSAASAEARMLLAKRVGDKVTVQQPFGPEKELRVAQIASSYRRLLTQSAEVLSSSLSPTKLATTVKMKVKEDGTADFSELQSMLAGRSEHVRRCLDSYSEAPITLGMLGKLLGVGVIDVVRGWQADGPQMYVGLNWVDEWEAAQGLFDSKACFVLDAATLVEMSMCGVLTALAALPNPLVSSKTRELIQGRLEEAKVDRSSGTAFERDGKLGFAEITSASRLKSVAQLQELVSAVEQYCTVEPAYGPEEHGEMLRMLGTILPDEEYSVLMLALERDAVVVCTDGRLRLLAKECGAQTAWPQMLYQFALGKDALETREYSIAVAQLLFGNRNFVSISAENLVFICFQGDAWLQHGIRRFKTFVSSEIVDYNSAVRVVLKFFGLVLDNARCQMGAFTELVTHLCEALMRHKACHPEFLPGMKKFFAQFFGPVQELSEMYPPVRTRLDEERGRQRAALEEALDAAHAASRLPEEFKPLRITVLFGTATPYLIFKKPAHDTVDSLAMHHQSRKPFNSSDGSELLAPTA